MLRRRRTTGRPRHLEKGGLTSQTNAERLVGLGRSASRTEPSTVEVATFREAYGPVDSTSAVRIIADVWADLVRNDEDAESQQLLKTAMEHPGVDKESLREALLDTVRQMVEEVRVEPSPMTTAGKEVLNDLAPKLASKKEKTGSSKKKPKQ